jgi:hypothetical protein
MVDIAQLKYRTVLDSQYLSLQKMLHSPNKPQAGIIPENCLIITSAPKPTCQTYHSVGKPKWQLLWPLVVPETLQKYRNFSVQVHIGFKTLLYSIPLWRANKLEEIQAHTVSQQALPTQILLPNDLQAQQGILSILNHIPSLKLFLNRWGKSRRCHMRPVPVVFLRMAFTLQLSAQRQKKERTKWKPLHPKSASQM